MGNKKSKPTLNASVNETSEFYISQIKTTKAIIERFSETGEFSPTMLINSLLSLVILPFENAKRRDREKVFPGKYKELEKKLGFSPVIFQPISGCRNGEVDYGNRTIYAYINKFRNGIAHQNLSVSVAEDRSIRITIYNKYENKDCKKCTSKKCTHKGLEYSNGGVLDFKITVTVGQLQKLAIYIADSYLKAIGER